MIKFKKSEIDNVARKLTHDSELFGDEVLEVMAQLSSLSNSANKFGCRMEGSIADCWGNTIKVVALPDKYQDNWTF